MLDAEPARLIKTGSINVSASRIEINGFRGDGTSCRDIAVLALVWAIGQLQAELTATLQAPGAGKAVVN